MGGLLKLLLVQRNARLGPPQNAHQPDGLNPTFGV